MLKLEFTIILNSKYKYKIIEIKYNVIYIIYNGQTTRIIWRIYYF